MQETWIEIEYIFREQGIYFELRSWVYYCFIESRKFYYSPNTGKWRLKGERTWQTSNSPEDFITQAKVYTPHKYKTKSKTSQSHQQKTDCNKSKNQQTKQKSKNQQTKQTHQTKNSSDKQSESYKSQQTREALKDIRSEFLRVFDDCLQEQRKRNYKIGWIWYKLIEQLTPSIIEICWLSVIFDYSPSWAVYKIRELYGFADYNTIITTIKINRNQWLDYFKQRWCQQQKYHHQKAREEQAQTQKEYQQKYSSDQHHSRSFNYRYKAYLRIMGLTFPFTYQELKKAYRQKALQTHPDSGGTAEAFLKINQAYETLSDYIKN